MSPKAKSLISDFFAPQRQLAPGTTAAHKRDNVDQDLVAKRQRIDEHIALPKPLPSLLHQTGSAETAAVDVVDANGVGTTNSRSVSATLALLRGGSASQLPRRHMLDSNSWVDEGRLPAPLLPDAAQFERLWALHPAERGEIMMFGKMVRTPRWHQPYLHSYTYSGVAHRALPLAPELRPLFEWANALECVQPFGGFTGVLVNWYQDGNDYMGPHADDEKELVPRSPILSISLGQDRTLRVTGRSGSVKGSIDTATMVQRDFPMHGGSYIVMGGRMQERYKHAVPKVSGAKGKMLSRRINITFRVFKV